MNHEELIKELAKALCRIGDALPQAEILLMLHPTAVMKELVMTLYIQIIKFARRAWKWFRESPMVHALKAITHPYTLRFKDTVESISETSRRIERLALTLSMAELRKTREELADARREQSAIHEVTVETRQKIDAYHNIQFAGLLDTNRRVCEIQFSQLMSFASTTPFATPEVIRNYHTTRRNRNRRRGTGSSVVFQQCPQLQMWASETKSAEVAICGGFASRRVIRDFAADIIDLILEARLPTLWALDLPDMEIRYSPEDIVRYLVSQVLRKNHTLLNEKSGALSAARYQSASSVEDWFALLGSVLEGMPQVYFIVDMEFLQKSVGGELSWVLLFRHLFECLKARSLATAVKVAFLSSRSTHRAEIRHVDQHKILELPRGRQARVAKGSDNRRTEGRRTGRGRIAKSPFFGNTAGATPRDALATTAATE
ncbi:hypothetical protein BDV96DRAFT_156385 [Lophiotrema nucula]|uniref:DUF7708 domain-containing protein n=1 Tax=Lophiotrema nucula TaxID=690887 RepID=A0A6A5YZZ1_9PLEO|nr:hypothetical protein BDV96DRAFT_156385 [Lophiotrema nucula]